MYLQSMKQTMRCAKPLKKVTFFVRLNACTSFPCRLAIWSNTYKVPLLDEVGRIILWAQNGYFMLKSGL